LGIIYAANLLDTYFNVNEWVLPFCIVSQTSDNETEDVGTISDLSRDIELADILELDIYDFDVEELADSKEHAADMTISIRVDRT
jgi:hypothetical protein